MKTKNLLRLSFCVSLIFNFQFSIFNFLRAQDPVLMEIGNERITKSQFMAEFETSVASRLPKTATAAERRKALDEYVELYATFRAKMLDAHSKGYDTTASLLSEMAKYRAELAAPYLIDSAVLDRLLHEAYDRNHYSVHAAHILVRCNSDAKPEDTLAAYKQICALRDRIVSGEDFFAVASDEERRRNADAPVRPNEGDLGYFTAFEMVYPFESAAYALEVGELSQPVRSRFGYHIIKCLDKVRLHGRLDMAHIWIGTRDTAAGQVRINAIYERIKNGSPFEMEARGSDDRSTRNNGGLLADATLNTLPVEYVHKLEGMKPGEVSEPFFTQYGWHIIKLVRADTLAAFEDMIPYYKQRMVRDQRGEASRKAFAKTCRKKYGVVDYTAVPADKKGRKMKASLDELASQLPDSIFLERWDGDASRLTDLRPLVKVVDRDYDVRDLAAYIHKHQKLQDPTDMGVYVRRHYEDFIDSVAVAYADSQLENDYPDFAALLEDYRRGLMIFDYNDKMIWSKAIYDTVGFADYYNRASVTKDLANAEDSVFFWHQRARVAVYDIADSNLIAKAKVIKVLEKGVKKNLGSTEMKEQLLKAIGKNADKNSVAVKVDQVERTRQQLLADNQWQRGVYVAPHDKGYRAIVVEDVMGRTLKGQAEARGYYLNEYQNEVERNLNESLHRKYNVKIHRDVLKDIAF